MNTSYVLLTPNNNVCMSTKAMYNGQINNPPVSHVNRGNTSIGQGVLYPLSSTMADDHSLVCGDPVLYPPLKTQNSHRPPFESPAKAFARLKAKVLKEQMCKETESKLCSRDRDTQDRGLLSPKKRQHPWTIAELKENQSASFYPYEAETLTLSPTRSPPKAFSLPFSNFSSKDLPLSSPGKDMGRVFKTVNRLSPRKQILGASPMKARPLASSMEQQGTALEGHVLRASCSATPAKVQPPSFKSFGSHAGGLSGDVDIMENGHTQTTCWSSSGKIFLLKLSFHLLQCTVWISTVERSWACASTIEPKKSL